MAQRDDKGLGVGSEVGEEHAGLRAPGGRVSRGRGARARCLGGVGRLHGDCRVSQSSVAGAHVPAVVIGGQGQGSDFLNACVEM